MSRPTSITHRQNPHSTLLSIRLRERKVPKRGEKMHGRVGERKGTRGHMSMSQNLLVMSASSSRITVARLLLNASKESFIEMRRSL